ncbi:MAG: undecaprenyldiphospho-muramoylpentapeptide beta-N-acetylglucosaminyltransferase [Myxococcota bacterium]
MKGKKRSRGAGAPIRLMVAGGGTGGHLFPGIAVADELLARADAEVCYVGTPRGLEARVIPARGQRLETLDVSPLKGRSAVALMGSLAKLPRSLLQARKLVERFTPDAVLGVGGYAAGPVVLAAASLGVPTALMEQNAHVGLTNRWLARFVDRAYVAFAETRGMFRGKARLVGNPIRGELRGVRDRSGERTLLVFGGSQGATALNEDVPAAVARLPESLRRSWRTVHQAGSRTTPEQRAVIASTYESAGVRVEVVPFIDDMASAYGSADLVLCRAGATTLAELGAVGRASVLVPFPYAADDHQTKNARAFERAGAACIVPQTRLAGLADVLASLMGDDRRREAMADAARGLGRPDAACRVVEDLAEWLGWKLTARSAQSFSGGVKGKAPLAPEPAAKPAEDLKGEDGQEGRAMATNDKSRHRRRTDAPSRPLAAQLALQGESAPRRRRGERGADGLQSLSAGDLRGEGATTQAQLRGYGAYIPATRRRSAETPRRPLVGEALVWEGR